MIFIDDKQVLPKKDFLDCLFKSNQAKFWLWLYAVIINWLRGVLPTVYKSISTTTRIQRQNYKGLRWRDLKRRKENGSK